MSLRQQWDEREKSRDLRNFVDRAIAIASEPWEPRHEIERGQHRAAQPGNNRYTALPAKEGDPNRSSESEIQQQSGHACLFVKITADPA